MKSYCETKEEYATSQNLLFGYLSSTNATKSCGIDLRDLYGLLLQDTLHLMKKIFFSVIGKC